ncbi:hypothetical protein [Lewinella cohaerens]|uniref:hypothetical protein n=1 Tax=Lewinella cohaerens TaxID=70995 RepID=UPI0003A54C12|nr:hypothetical protein [Lewinella cohaerens]
MKKDGVIFTISGGIFIEYYNQYLFSRRNDDLQRGNGLNSSRKTRKIIFVGTFSAKYFFYLQIYLSLQPLREMKRKTMAP